MLAVLAPGVDAADGQQRLRAGIRAQVALQRLARDDVQADPADPRRGAGEVAVDQLRRQADRLEDLRPVVGLDRRDAHLRERLEQALPDRLDDVALRLLHRVGPDDVGQRLEHQVRVDGRGAVADQRGEVVHLARLARFEHEAGPQPRPLADEVVVDGRDGEQRRDRRARRADAAVGEHDDVRAVGDRLRGLLGDPPHGPDHALGAVGDRPGDRDGVRAEHGRVDAAQRLELVVAQDRVRDDELVGVIRPLVEQVRLRADARLDRHHHGLADGVDRRVGDLREELLEVREERRRLVGQDGERDVVAHRADRLLALGRHRREQHPQVLLRVAERELAGAERLRRPAALALGQVVQPHDALLVPLAVGAPRGDAALDLVVGDDAARADVDEEELAGLQPPLAQDVLRRLVEHAGLRAEHDPAVLGLHPAAGAQAVAVQRRADHAAVGEADRRRPVPRLHHARVEGVEGPQVLRQVVALLPRLRHHHHHRVRERAARQRQQLEHVVERGRVRARGPDDREHLLQVVAEQLGRQLRLARPHPVDVAAQRVDLAVVGDVAERVRELPARERVRREARVDERERRLGPLVLQVRVVAQQLRRREHALVDDRPRAERRDHELGPGRQLGDAADHVQLALEGVLIVRELGRRGHDEVLDVRREPVGRDPDVVLLHRDVAPGHDALALGLDRLGEQPLELVAAVVLLRQEAHRDAVLARGRELGIDDAAHQLVRELHQHARAVARVRVGAGRSPVLEVLQGGDRPPDRLVRGLAAQPRDERDAARVVLVLRVVQTDRLGRARAMRQRTAPEGCGLGTGKRKGSSGRSPGGSDPLRGWGRRTRG